MDDHLSPLLVPARIDGANDLFCHFVDWFVFPEAQDSPSRVAQPLVSVSVSPLVARDLC